uniref:Uncharacterized protein n=1 Tax=Tanacetum cinerariifolium TaxID=118510 RepID=A0A699I8Q4_TANCI|nr:hypothetical protein [Tanacetum cinerariifolium]
MERLMTRKVFVVSIVLRRMFIYYRSFYYVEIVGTNERELKKERRKQCYQEVAGRSRLRKREDDTTRWKNFRDRVDIYAVMKGHKNGWTRF